MAELHVHYPDGKITVVPLEGPDVVIGRDANCDLTLEDALTSRRHARIWFGDDKQWWIEDLHSKNGSTLNDQALTSARLAEGDRVGIGTTYLVLRRVAEPRVVLEEPETRIGTTSAWTHDTRLHLPQQRLEKLYELNERLSGRFDRDDLLQEVVNICIEALGLERAGLALWAGDPTPPRWVIIKNLRSDGSGEFRISRTLVDRALYHSERVLINDPATQLADPTVSMISNHICSAMCVPLIYHNVVRGVLYGDRVTSSGGYTKEDIDFFAALGRQAAMGLANVQLLDEVQRRRHIEMQLQWARQIQNRLFPREPLAGANYAIEALNDPGQHVSGDYFDYLLREDGLVTVVVADVSGKGVAAAMLMANLQAAVHVTLGDDRDVSRAAGRLNTLICQNVSSDRFITALIGLFDPETRIFNYVNVGHPPPYHITPDGTLKRLPDTSSLPLGVAEDVQHHAISVPMGPGPSTLFFYTDGVPDAENDKDEHFGEPRLEELLKSYAADTPRDMIQKIRRSIQQFIRHTPQIDDITMLALQVK